MTEAGRARADAINNKIQFGRIVVLNNVHIFSTYSVSESAYENKRKHNITFSMAPYWELLVLWI